MDVEHQFERIGMKSERRKMEMAEESGTWANHTRWSDGLRRPLRSSQGARFAGTRCSAKAGWELPVGSDGQIALMSTVEP